MKKAIVALARPLAVILHRLIEEPLDQISGAVETPFSVLSANLVLVGRDGR
jgi:hypothetical protein